MGYEHKIADQLRIRPEQVASTIELIDAENTLPFIARYRKENTGGLDEEQIRQISEMVVRLRTLDERRSTIIATIQEQGKLEPELHRKLLEADKLTILEDLYLPYKPKRRTRAMIAKERGLQELANLIVNQPVTSQTLTEMARPFLSEQVSTEEEAWSGARDIVAEMISDHADIRRTTREKAMQWGVLRSSKIEDTADERSIYQLYYEFESGINRLRPHQVLAINRGEAEKVLRVKIEIPERDWGNAIWAYFCPVRKSALAEQLDLTIEDAAERLLLPAIERDVRRELSEKAESHAIGVFAANLRGLLSQPPLSGRTILGIDPGFRTGCKVAVVDPTGRLLETATIYPHEPQKEWEKSIKILAALAQKHGVSLFSIGNGTASRETEQLVAEVIRTQLPEAHFVIANEAGASVYSASPLARAELPDLDVSLRGAVSIARRVQDPLAELVKIEPRSIGVGLYQHDVDQKQLADSLHGVVESVVNRVGVDANTASPALLTYVAGIGPKLAERIVVFRQERGSFQNRDELRNVSGLGPKAFEQAAGFLRIHHGNQPLDSSAIHPESYPIAEAILNQAELSMELNPASRKPALDELLRRKSIELLAKELGTGVPTLSDIFEQLVRPGRDPRQDTPAPILRSDVLKMEDLVVGMRVKGTVRNVVDFGAFIDIGVKQDGLLHRSQIPRSSLLSVGDILEVEVLKVEIDRGRISLGWASKEE